MTSGLPLPELIAPPAEDVVDLAILKEHVHAEDASDDALLTRYLAAAVGYFDGPRGALGRALVTQTWMQAFPEFGCLRLPLAPVQSIVSVKYLDSDEVEQTLASSEWREVHRATGTDIVVAEPPTVAADREDAVRVTFVAGFGAASAVPAEIALAILHMAAHWYMVREPVVIGTIVSNVPETALAVARRYRRHGG